MAHRRQCGRLREGLPLVGLVADGPEVAANGDDVSALAEPERPLVRTRAHRGGPAGGHGRGGGWGEPQATELQKRWEQAVGGYRNAGKIAVLGSKTTYQSVALTARDSEWLLQRGWRATGGCGAFGVPEVLVRMSEATFANAEQARAEFWEGTLQPRLDRIARMLTARLLPLVTTQNLVARFDYSAVKALNENSLGVAQQAVQAALGGAVSVDEVPHRLAPPPLGSPMGDRLIIPGTLTLKLPDE